MASPTSSRSEKKGTYFCLDCNETGYGVCRWRQCRLSGREHIGLCQRESHPRRRHTRRRLSSNRLLVVLFRKFRQPKGAELAALLGEYDEIAVLMHPNPDPDAMSAAMGVQALADRVGTDATIHYPGKIRHQENRAFETVLNLDFDRIESAADLPDAPVVLVDHNEPRGFSGAEGVNPLAVIDHHPGGGEGTEFTDVRTDNGACASIFAEYFETMGGGAGRSRRGRFHRR